MTVRSLSTVRPTTDPVPVSGFASPFPVLLGGTETLRTLRTAASLSQATPVTGMAYAPGFAANFPVTLGGTEALRTLRTTAAVVITPGGPAIRNMETVKP